MKERSKKPYALTSLLVLSTAAFSALGIYTGLRHYSGDRIFTMSNMPLAIAMQGLHDGLYIEDLHSSVDYTVENLSVSGLSASLSSKLIQEALTLSEASSALLATNATHESAITTLASVSSATAEVAANMTYDFTTAADNYFDDACFIGDSRTVGINDYAGIEGATFLCKSSLTIFDYDKPKISYNGKTTSIREVLKEKQFAKIYIMVGINECGTGTPESFCENYRKVVEDIRELQPDALIFIQGNLLVTEHKSNESDYFTNDNISARNALIATIANDKDIFYIDINESSLCEDNALVSDYTWDQVHIKAQYYGVWKDFLLAHAIVK